MPPKKTYTGKTPEQRQKEIDETIAQMNEKIESYYRDPEAMKEFLEFMGNFHEYSARNQALIQSQYGGAMAVAPFAKWKNDHETSVRKGEKGIKILAPAEYIIYTLHDGSKVTKANANEEQLKKIKSKDYQNERKGITFKIGHVFDITQTELKPEQYPEFYPNKRYGSHVENYGVIMQALEMLAKRLDVEFIPWNDTHGVSKGVSYSGFNKISLNPRNTEQENILTTLHELAHAKLHGAENKLERALKEYQAEMVSYATAKHFGFEYELKALEYLGEWGKKAKTKEKTELIQEVSQTVREFIQCLDHDLAYIKEIEKEEKIEISAEFLEAMKQVEQEAESNFER